MVVAATMSREPARRYARGVRWLFWNRLNPCQGSVMRDFKVESLSAGRLLCLRVLASSSQIMTSICQ
jgi:hypothetical protein